MLILFLLAVGMYLVSGNVIRALWLSFVSAFLFNNTFDVIIGYELPKDLINLIRPVRYVYSLSLADLYLIPLLYFLIKKRNNLVPSYRWGWKDLILLGIILCGVGSTLIASTQGIYVWYTLYIFIKYIVIFYLTILVCSDKENIKATLEIILLFCFFNALLVMLQKFHGGPLGWAVENFNDIYADELKSLYRPGGSSWSANLTSSILAMIMPFPLVLGAIKSKFNKNLMRYIFISMIFSIVIMASRHVWVVVIITLIAIYLKDRKIFDWLVEKYMSVNILIRYGTFAISLVLLLPFMFARLISLLNTTGFEYRFNHLYLTYDMLVKNPIGIGFDMFKYKIIKTYPAEDYMWDSSPQHNLFLEMATSTGIVGGLLFILFCYLVLKEKIIYILNNNFKSIGVLLSFAVVIYFCVNQVYSSLFSVTITELFWLILGISYVVGHDKKKN